MTRPDGDADFLKDKHANDVAIGILQLGGGRRHPKHICRRRVTGTLEHHLLYLHVEFLEETTPVDRAIGIGRRDKTFKCTCLRRARAANNKKRLAQHEICEHAEHVLL